MSEINRTVFGHMPDGTVVEKLTLRDRAISCEIITYGGAVRTLTVPDRNGQAVDVVLGFDTLEDYLRQDKYIGALIGRYANRIGGAVFTLNGKAYPLAANDGANHLHGGPASFDKKIWAVEKLTEHSAALSLASPDGEEGYPGNLRVQVVYTLRNGGLEIEYSALSDRDTLCNLTNHTYFNLSGHGSGPVAGQYIQLMAERFTPAEEGSIPTGAIVPAAGTVMDLRTPQPIGEHADDSFDQLVMAGGYDHNWVVDGENGMLRPAAKAWSPDTGILLEMETTLPGVQFYSGNYLDGCPAGKGGAPYGKRWGFCLESQLFPDAPHHDNFPSAVLAAGEVYRSKTVYRFGIADRPGTKE